LIVFDASALVSAALKADSVPERALLRAEEVDVFALSAVVDAGIAEVFARPKFAQAIPIARTTGSNHTATLRRISKKCWRRRSGRATP